MLMRWLHLMIHQIMLRRFISYSIPPIPKPTKKANKTSLLTPDPPPILVTTLTPGRGLALSQGSGGLSCSPRKNMGLDAIELVLAVEDAFGIAIPNAVAAEMISPAIMITYVQNAVASCPDRSRRWTHDEVRQVVRQIISEQLCVENFNDTDEFVRDLRLD